MPETDTKTNFLPQKCSFFPEALGCPLPTEWYSGKLKKIKKKNSVTNFATIHSLFFHTHTPNTSTNIRFLKCEAGLPGGIFTFYVAVDEATADTGYVTVKSRDFLEERKVLPNYFLKI